METGTRHYVPVATRRNRCSKASMLCFRTCGTFRIAFPRHAPARFPDHAPAKIDVTFTATPVLSWQGVAAPVRCVMAGCHGSAPRTAHRVMDALKRWHMTVPECVSDWTKRCAEQLRRSSSSCDASSSSLPMRPLLRLLPIQRSRSQYQ